MAQQMEPSLQDGDESEDLSDSDMFNDSFSGDNGIRCNDNQYQPQISDISR